ncbi:hypothetical protein [Pseudothauera nasutitermitis]|uniref:hypothetical protein n=1 Tax=Pseudothauera nasutitermitis TaxID=2565930 RepID=UPI001454C1D4|nr:hypothetical protein [Pseudothauera nasutitermitis]
MQEKEAKLDLSTVVVIADIVSDETEERSSEWRHDLEKVPGLRDIAEKASGIPMTP